MYRQNENPRALEKELEEVKARFEKSLEECKTEDERYDVIESYQERIDSLEERINFAWQDEEYEEDMRALEAQGLDF